MALRIGITGGIGCGKTLVAGIFKILGIPVFDADAAAKDIMEHDAALRESLVSVFGPQTYLEGKLNRKYLAEIVFRDPFKLAQLNALVHPLTIAAAEEWANKQHTPYTIKEAALFFETGAAVGFDYIIGVSAPRHIRIKRVMNRDKISREEVMARMDRQMNETVKMRLCDFIVLNDDEHLLIPQVIALHEKFTKNQPNS